jgi:hypothetical protein
MHTAQAFSIIGPMPDNTRPPRYVHDDRPPLGARAIMRQFEELAKARGLIGVSVAYKMNARGEHVVALIFSSFSKR